MFVVCDACYYKDSTVTTEPFQGRMHSEKVAGTLLRIRAFLDRCDANHCHPRFSRVCVMSYYVSKKYQVALLTFKQNIHGGQSAARWLSP